jgi:hypothetical protein
MISGIHTKADPRYRRWVVATTVGELAGFTIAGPAVVLAAIAVAPPDAPVLMAVFGLPEAWVWGSRWHW